MPHKPQNEDRQAVPFTRTCMCSPLPIPCTEPSRAVKDRLRRLVIDQNELDQISRLFLDNINRGLGKNTHNDAIVKCFITYVQDLPDGSELGKFLALDLGGTNFRVLLIKLEKNHFEMWSKVFIIPGDIMVGTGPQLFDHIASCMYKFMNEVNVLNEKLPLGFTFSFPLKQVSLTKGTLERWTKGFNCPDVVGDDVVRLLQEAINRRGDIQIDVTAVLNDTTGTLMSCAWKNHNCRIGLIIGTGSNACYVEKQENAENFDDEDCGSGNVLINTEWGAFGDDGSLDFIRTKYDRIIDEESINPGKQLHEKMISGMYLGELVRLIMNDLTEEGLLFNGKGSEELATTNSFKSKYVTEVDLDDEGDYTNCKAVLRDILGISRATIEDCKNVRYICESVTKRSAHLVSAGLSAIMNKMGTKRVTVGVDGSLYRFHPHYHNLMMEKMSKMVRSGIVFDLMLSEDGSGRGAALVAATAYKKEKGL